MLLSENSELTGQTCVGFFPQVGGQGTSPSETFALPEIRSEGNRFSGRTGMHEKSRVSSAIKYDCFKLDGSGNCIIRKTWLHCIWFEKIFRLNEVIPYSTRSVNWRLCLQHFNEYNVYEYSPMNKPINKFLAEKYVIQSLEQQFD